MFLLVSVLDKNTNPSLALCQGLSSKISFKSLYNILINPFGAHYQQLLWLEMGQVLGGALQLSPYDALLDRFDIGSSQKVLDRLFSKELANVVVMPAPP